MLDPHPRTRDNHWESLFDLRRIIRCQLRIVLRLEIRGAGNVLGLGYRRTMLDHHRRTRNEHWESLLDLQRIIRRKLRIVLRLEIREAGIVLGLGNRRM